MTGITPKLESISSEVCDIAIHTSSAMLSRSTIIYNDNGDIQVGKRHTVATVQAAELPNRQFAYFLINYDLSSVVSPQVPEVMIPARRVHPWIVKTGGRLWR
jgi:hypothetical protein